MLLGKEVLNAYLEDHRYAWAPSTAEMETKRLGAVLDYLNGDATALWELLESRGLGAYTRRTLWSRVMHFWDWCIAHGVVAVSGEGEKNAYRKFKRRNARLFRHVYERKAPTISFQQAVALIKTIPDSAIRRKATELLYSGCRWTESFTYDRTTGTVVGKGDKKRRVHMPEVEGDEFRASYHTFLHALKRVGLNPHDLRKIWARTMASGMNEWELLQAAGWESLETSLSYIRGNAVVEQAQEILKNVNAKSHS